MFAHIPFYHPSSRKVMGEQADGVRQQAYQMRAMLTDYANVKGLFFGHTHEWGDYTDPENKKRIIGVSCAGTKLCLSPSYTLVTIQPSGEFKAEERRG